KMNYNEKTKIAEIIGEKSGLTMHSWLQMDDDLWDEISFDIVRGDLAGMKIKTYLYDEDGKTLIIGVGKLDGAKSQFSSFVATLLPTVAEVVIDVATNNFRSYIEEEYQKNRLKAE